MIGYIMYATVAVVWFGRTDAAGLRTERWASTPRPYRPWASPSTPCACQRARWGGAVAGWAVRLTRSCRCPRVYPGQHDGGLRLHCAGGLIFGRWNPGGRCWPRRRRLLAST
ncbi:hypothetical protein QJS66_08585 [Kocuria rhizophila]|nr:hypothetical protein QJS66_08585 [Kocuria rhizophila]